MKTQTPKISTPYLNNAAALWTATGQEPQIVETSSGFREFQFDRTPDLFEAWDRYEAGLLMVDARLVMIHRAQLVKAVRPPKQGGDACGV